MWDLRPTLTGKLLSRPLIADQTKLINANTLTTDKATVLLIVFNLVLSVRRTFDC